MSKILLEIDGKKVEAKQGMTILDAAQGGNHIRKTSGRQ